MARGDRGWVAVSGLVLLLGCAGGPEPNGAPIGGTVTGVYEEPLPGILLDRELRPARDPAATLWVAVRPSEALSGGRSSVLARIEDPDILAGDFVVVETGDGPWIMRPGPAEQAATALPFLRVADATRSAPPRPASARRGVRVEVEVEGP